MMRPKQILAYGIPLAVVFAMFYALLQAQVSVKNYFVPCSGVSCDNVFEVGGSVDVGTGGGDLDIESGGVFRIAGTAVDTTAAELNRTADVSVRLVAAGATLSATVATHEGKIILLDTAAGSTVTLPAAAGTGAVFRFVISVLATSNSHIVKVADATDIMQGVIVSESDNAADAAIAFTAGASDDTITLNRTTTGSVTRGEWIELVDVATDLWLVRGVTASNGVEVTPFSNTVS